MQNPRIQYTAYTGWVIKCFITLLVITCALLPTKGQTWNNVGSAGFTADSSWYSTIAIDAGGTPYVAFADKSNSNKATVRKFDGTNWVLVGSAGFSAGGVEYTCIAIGSDGTPYVAYDDWGNGGKATVMKFNGTSWVAIGSAGFTPGQTWFMTLALGKKDTPYVAFMDYSASTAFTEKALVMKFKGTTWATVGVIYPSNGAANYTSLAMDTSGKPYLAFQDFSQGGKASVVKLGGSLLSPMWQPVGSLGFSAGNALFTSLALDKNNTPYVVYMYTVNAYKATVKKFTGSSWVTVGTAGFSPDSAFYTSIAIDSSGTPYVVFQDDGHGGKVSVMKFDGSNWVAVGTEGFSAGTSYYNSIAIARDGTPYVCFEDGGNGGKLTVMKAGGGVGTKLIAGVTKPVLSVFPNPSSGSLSIELSSAHDENASLVITNLVGEKVYESAVTTNKLNDVQLSSAPGVYFITVRTMDQTLTSKIVVH